MSQTPKKVSLGEIIKRYRKENGITQQQFADAAGISVSTIRNIEHGFEGYESPTEHVVCQAMGLSTADVLRIEYNGYPEENE